MLSVDIYLRANYLLTELLKKYIYSNRKVYDFCRPQINWDKAKKNDEVRNYDLREKRVLINFSFVRSIYVTDWKFFLDHKLQFITQGQMRNCLKVVALNRTLVEIFRERYLC